MMSQENDRTPGLDEDAEYAFQHGTFTLGLVPRAQRQYDVRAALETHETVLRPLLGAATECVAFGLDPESEVFRSAHSFLERWKGKYRVRSGGDPITGHELFWNAQGGRRGTIVIVVPAAKFVELDLFPKCHRASVTGNFRSAHTLSALRYARDAVADGHAIAACLPRNNGFEWMDIHARPDIALTLFERARVETPAD